MNDIRESLYPSPWSERGIDLWVGAIIGLIATAPLVMAAFGWGNHWNAYLNLMLTLESFVLWLTVYACCKRVES